MLLNLMELKIEQLMGRCFLTSQEVRSRWHELKVVKSHPQFLSLHLRHVSYLIPFVIDTRMNTSGTIIKELYNDC